MIFAAKSHTFNNPQIFYPYRNFIEFIPMIIWSLFAGSFLDKIAGSTRILLIIGIVGDAVVCVLAGLNVYFFDWSE